MKHDERTPYSETKHGISGRPNSECLLDGRGWLLNNAIH